MTAGVFLCKTLTKLNISPFYLLGNDAAAAEA